MSSNSRFRRAAWAVPAAAALLLAACTSTATTQRTTATTSTPPTFPGLAPGAGPLPVTGVRPTPDVTTLSSTLLHPTRVASFPTMITAIASYPGRPELLVGERDGHVFRIRLKAGAHSLTPQRPSGPLLDLSHQTTADAERGLFSLVFDRSGQNLFVSHSALDGAVTITRLAYDTNRETYSVADTHDVVAIPHAYSSHNGGGMAVDTNGDLYMGVGDMSLQFKNPVSQDPSTPLGSVVRIPPSQLAGQTTEVSVPRSDIVAKGLRNPFRVSLDTERRHLWIGDVGDRAVEEIDRLDLDHLATTPVNYGWPYFEGNRRAEAAPAGRTFTPPVFTYQHTPTLCALLAGPVYRGAALPGLAGALIYGDFCSDTISAVITDPSGTKVLAHRVIAKIPQPTVSIGVGPFGELYEGDSAGDVYRLDPPTWNGPSVPIVRTPGGPAVTTTTIPTKTIDPASCGIIDQLQPLGDLYDRPLADRPVMMANVVREVGTRVPHLPATLRHRGELVLDALKRVQQELAAAHWDAVAIHRILDDIDARRGGFAALVDDMDLITKELQSRCP